MTAHAKDLKGTRYALWKNPERLTERQEAKLSWIAKVNIKLYRAYLLKEQLREVFSVKGVKALVMRWHLCFDALWPKRQSRGIDFS